MYMFILSILRIFAIILNLVNFFKEKLSYFIVDLDVDIGTSLPFSDVFDMSVDVLETIVYVYVDVLG